MNETRRSRGVRVLLLVAVVLAVGLPVPGEQRPWHLPAYLDWGRQWLGEAESDGAVPLLLPGGEEQVLVFLGHRDAEGVHVTDGTPGGTRCIGRPWAEGASLGRPVLHDGRAWFLAGDPGDGTVGLYRTDGTETGTIEAIPPSGATRLRIDFLLSFEDRLWLAGVPPGSTDPTLLVSDGTEAGTAPCRSDGVPRFDDTVAWPAGGLLYFNGTTAGEGREVWRTDGTEEGTFLLRDIRPGTGSSVWNTSPGDPGPDQPLAEGDHLWFAADDGSSGTEPWRTEGTPGGTGMVADLVPGPGSSLPRFVGEAGGSLLFLACDATKRPILFRSDGTAQGTSAVRTFDVESTGLSSGPLGPFAGTLLFAVRGDSSPLALWRTDGTPGGTVPVADISGTLDNRRADSLLVLGRSGLAFFRTHWSDWPPSFWRTDGTAAGTRRVASGWTPVAWKGTLFDIDVTMLEITRVNADCLGLSACDVDDDGDGFSTELEARGSRWWEEGSTPLGEGGGGPAGDLDMRKAAFRVSGWEPAGDELHLDGRIGVSADFTRKGATVLVDAGGVIREFTLDRHGRGSSGDAKLRVRKPRAPARGETSARFTFTIRDGRIMEALADEGIWEPRPVEDQPIVLPVTILADGRAFRARVPLLWTVVEYGAGDAVLPGRSVR